MYLGVDTHKRTHEIVALDEQGRVMGLHSLANTAEGWAAALAWAQRQWPERHWGIENSGFVGQGLRPVPARPGRGRRARGAPAPHGAVSPTGPDAG